MQSPCPTPPAPGNRRVVRTGCRLSDDVKFRCRGRGTWRFHAGAKRQWRGKCGLGKVWQNFGRESKNATIRFSGRNSTRSTFEPIRQKTEFFRQRSQSPYKRARYCRGGIAYGFLYKHQKTLKQLTPINPIFAALTHRWLSFWLDVVSSADYYAVALWRGCRSASASAWGPFWPPVLRPRLRPPRRPGWGRVGLPLRGGVWSES